MLYRKRSYSLVVAGRFAPGNNGADEENPLFIRREAPHNQRMEQMPFGLSSSAPLGNDHTKLTSEVKMSGERTKVFDLVSGFAALREQGELFKFYLLIVSGILSHWIWEVLVAAVQSGKFEFGSWVIIVARIGIAFIVGLVSFIGIWKQLEKVDPKVRIFAAITQGFAVDALAAPVAAAANS